MSHEILVIGGGPAGAALAIHLARAGRDVLVLERTATAHDKVCGEFLSGEALAELHQLGIDASALGAASIHNVEIIAGRRKAIASLPFPAMGLSRRVLDDALLRHAAQCGAVIRRGVTAQAVTGAGVRTNDGIVIARHVVIATGKLDLRGRPRMVRGGLPRWTGLQWRLRSPAAPLVSVHMLNGGYAGLQPVGTDQINLCLAMRDARAGWRPLVEQGAPAVRMMLQAAGWPQPRAIAGVPYGHLHAGPEDGLFRIGDQFAVIPSFCGDGIAIALHSGRRAATAILQGHDASVYHRTLRHELAPQFRRAAWLSRAAACRLGPTLFVAMAQRWPDLLRHAARLTRIPDRSCPGET